jgi:hypothetical protein
MGNEVKHAVITNQGIAMIGEDRHVHKYVLSQPISNIVDAWKVGRPLGINRFWVLPGSHFDSLRDRVVQATEDYKLTITYNDMEYQTGVRFAVCKKDGYEIALGWTDHFGWEVDCSLDILSTIDYLEKTPISEKKKLEVLWSPVHMGRTVFRGKYHANDTLQEKIKECSFDLHELPYGESACAIDWKSGMVNELVKEGMYLHHVDRNSSYPTSAKSVYVGIGDPYHVTKGDEKIVPMEGGIYRVTRNVNERVFDDVRLPLIIPLGRQWVTYDILHLAMSAGYEIDILEGWEYSEAVPLLRTWADKMFSYRKEVRENVSGYVYERGRKNAENTVKLMAVGTLGSFGSKHFKQFRRPDWYASVIGKARVTILNALARFQKYNPVLVCKDDLWFATGGSDTEREMPELFIRSTQPGGFKVKGIVPVDTAVLEVLQSSRSVVTIHTNLKGREL